MAMTAASLIFSGLQGLGLRPGPHQEPGSAFIPLFGSAAPGRPGCLHVRGAGPLIIAGVAAAQAGLALGAPLGRRGWGGGSGAGGVPGAPKGAEWAPVVQENFSKQPARERRASGCWTLPGPPSSSPSLPRGTRGSWFLPFKSALRSPKGKQKQKKLQWIVWARLTSGVCRWPWCVSVITVPA